MTIVELLKQVKNWKSPSRDPWSNCLINSRETTKGQSYYYSGRHKDNSKTMCRRAGYISEIRESSLWASIRDYLTPLDVLATRTAGLKWNCAKLYGKFAALWFFLMTKDGSEEGAQPEWPSLCLDHRRNFGFDLGMFDTGWILTGYAWSTS